MSVGAAHEHGTIEHMFWSGPVRVQWIDEPTHRLASAAMLGSLNRGVSLVDWTSFVLMRELHIDRAFAFDPEFESQGLRVIPVT